MSIDEKNGARASDASYTDLNARIIDQWVDEGWEWGVPITHERYRAALEGDWSMQLTPTRIVRGLPFNPLRDPDLIPADEIEDWGMQFSHTLDEQIRGQILTGFSLLDLYEDTSGRGRLHELGIPTFWATLAQKPV